MNWLVFAVGAMLGSGIFNYLVKLSSGKLNTILALLIAISVQIPFYLGYLIYVYRQTGSIQVTKEGLILVAASGLVAILANVAFFMMYSAGAPISLGAPVYQTGGFIVAILLGLILLKEPLTFKIVLGYSFAILGIFLVATGR